MKTSEELTAEKFLEEQRHYARLLNEQGKVISPREFVSALEQLLKLANKESRTSSLTNFGISPSSFAEEDLVFAAVDLPKSDPQEDPCELFVSCSSIAEGMRVREELREFAEWQKA